MNAMEEKAKKIKTIIIRSVIILVVATILVLLSNPGVHKSAFDIFVAPPAIKLFWNNAYDYIRVQSEKTTYDIDEEITIDASCGFYLPQNACGFDTLSFDIACSEYMDVSISVGDLVEYPGGYEEFVVNNPGSKGTYGAACFHADTKDFDADQLILKRGFLGKINENSLQYHFKVTLKAKPDAPENFSGILYLRVCDNIGRGNSYVEFNFAKEGNTIILIGK